jgi:hypothetical protein
MKRTYINLMSIAFNGLLCLFLALPATAQNRGGGGNNGGGGGNSGGGGVTRSAPAPSNGGGQRPSYNGGGQQRVGSAPQHGNSIAPQQHGNVPQTNGVTRQVAGPRQGIGPGQRGVSATVQLGLSAKGGYRSYPALPGGNGVTRISPSRPYAGYYNAHGYYNSFYAPHVGFRLNVLPYGYYPFYFGPNQYFYSDGLYYQYLDNQYAVVEPPVGAAINSLPSNSQSIMINGIQYYELNGVYYQPITKDDGSIVYQVAGKDGELNTDSGVDNQQAAVAPPQIGDIVSTLPTGTRTIKINGQKYYVTDDDYYYQDAKDNNNNNVYKIVGTPSDGPNQ